MMKKILLTLFTVFMISSCNFESGSEDASGGGLFSNHQKVENLFLLIPPVDNTYIASENIDLVLRHSNLLTVTGSPRIEIDLGGTTVYADYLTGSGTDSLSFRYTVQPGDDDLNGIDIADSIELNGGNIEFSNAGVTVSANLEYATLSTSNVKVDTTAPSIALVTPPTAKTYLQNQQLEFIVFFDDIVKVAGTPQIAIDIGGVTAFAEYQSGSNSTNLLFRYTVGGSDVDVDGISISTPIELNGGSIEDINGNDAVLTFVPIPMPTTYVDGDLPFVTQIITPTNKTYLSGEYVSLTLKFSEIINITGTPRIQINIGTDSKFLEYDSGSGTDTLVFEYFTVPGDDDSNGITIGNLIDLNGGTIQDTGTKNASLGLSTPLTPGVIIDAGIPKVTSIAAPLNNTYVNSNEMFYTLNFDRAVDITGTPRLPILINSTDPLFIYADYISGTGTQTIIFRYIVQANDLDLDGIVIHSTIDLNAGTMIAANGINADLDITTPVGIITTTNILIDAAPPTVTAITNPTDSNYTTGVDIDFNVIFSKNVDVLNTPRLELDIGGVTRYANYLTGTGTSSLTFRYNVVGPDLDSDGISISNTSIDLNTTGTIKDIYGSNAGLDLTSFITPMPLVFVNYNPLNITSITPPADATYLETQSVDFIVNTSELVNIVGIPRIQLDIGGVTKYADYFSGTGTTALTFRYIVESSLLDIDGIQALSPLELNAGTIKNASLQDLDLAFTPPVMTSVLVDSTPSQITSITPPADSSYDVSENIDFIVNIDELVNIVGTPRLQIDIGGVTKYADYISGTGTTALTFRYVVEAGLLDIDGIVLVSPLDLNAGTIQNTLLQNLDLVFTPPVMPAVLVDSMPPIITSITPPADATYIETNDLDFIVNTDEIVNVIGTPRIQVDIGGVTKYADYFSGSGTTALTFRYTVEVGLTDADGITITSPVDLNSGTIQSAALENLALTFILPATGNILVDSQGSTITSVTPPIDATYIETNNMDFIANIDEIVNVVGAPRIQIDIGGVTKYADYFSGSGTTALTFRYVVEASLSDLDGITLIQPLDLNSGTIKNAGLEDMDLTFSAPVTPNIWVDSSAPIVAITTPIDTSYINISNDSAAFTVAGTCDENGQVVVLEVDAAAAALPVGFTCNGANFSGTIDTTGLIAGAHTIEAKLSDPAGNEGISTTINITKDINAPTISSVTPPINNFYNIGSNLDFIVNLDENTEVTGVPRIQLDVGGVTRYADYLSGTSSSALTFRYTVSPADEDLGGIGFFSSVIDLNGGTLIDTAGNPTNLNLDASVVLPNLSSVIVDGVIPTVAITSSPDITSANETTYSVSGTCSENGRTVVVDIDTISVSPTCTGGSWTTGSIDVSGRPDNASFPITADHTDQAGNNATQDSVIADKNTLTPTVAITFALDITSANESNYSVSGNCTENGILVDVNVGAINIQPNCSGGTWTTGTLDVSTLVDNPTISVTADHSTATQASTTIAKDTTSPIVIISSSPNINLTNQTSYIASGTCSENAVMVDVNIGVLNFTPTCNSGSWTTGSVDVSSLIDSGSISFTADHSTAPQASTSVSKNTSTPTVASLSVPTTLANSADPSWTLNDPGGFTINDFEINYRVKGSPTWLSFADGVSLDTSTSVTGLLASTTYEFRVRVQYDTVNYSDWSNTAEGETKPDTPLFSSPYAAMNVAGATTTNVVAYYNNTAVTLNGVAIAGSPLSKGQVVNITTAQFDIIDADKPIYTAGRRGSGGNTAKANIVWQPASWAGKNFSFNSTRNNPQQLHIFATENSNIEIKQGTTVLASTTLTSGNGTVLSWSVYGSYQVISTGTILAFHSSGAPATTLVDPKPLLPSSLEIIGFPSNSMRITTDVNSTNYSLIHSESTTASGSLNKADSISTSNLGGASEYAGDSLIISADQKIAGASFADSNGNCAAPFLPTSLMRKNYAINISSDWVAFASKQAGLIDVIDSSGVVVETLTLTRAGANPNAPYKVRRGTTPAGYRFFSTVPVAAWYQPDNDTGGADQDETILYGTNE